MNFKIDCAHLDYIAGQYLTFCWIGIKIVIGICFSLLWSFVFFVPSSQELLDGSASNENDVILWRIGGFVFSGITLLITCGTTAISLKELKKDSPKP